MPLADLISSARRVAVVGLAKNTGKTETLGAILRELDARARTVGVTSIGRDGEARDAIDRRIEKPRIRLAAGSLVATTDALLRASAIPHEPLRDTGLRTPLGRVQLARLDAPGAIEVAGPSAAADVREVADAMLALGADQVLVDGAIDRRAASSPAVCDGLVIATGAVLDEELEQVVARTRDAVELVRLPVVEDERVRAAAAEREESLLMDSRGGEPIALPSRFALSSSAHELGRLLQAYPGADCLVVRGAVHEPFLRELLAAARGRAIDVVVADGTAVFLAERAPGWYGKQGIAMRALRSTRLCAITANPVAPGSHSFDSLRLCALLEEAVPGVPVLDVRAAERSGAGVA